jgi:hypothetical protein
VTPGLTQVEAEGHSARTRQVRWLIPALAAASIVAVAVGATAVTTSMSSGARKPNPLYDPGADTFSTLLSGSVNGGSIIQAALGYRAIDPPR